MKPHIGPPKACPDILHLAVPSAVVDVEVRRERLWTPAAATPLPFCARFLIGGTCDNVTDLDSLLFCSGNEIHAPVDIRVIDGTFGGKNEGMH
jgi:hypothetical protein